MIEQRFGKLTVVEDLGRNERYSRILLFKCDCGTHKIIRMDAVLTGKTKSCGCLKAEMLKRGMKKRRPDRGERLAYAKKKALAKYKGIGFNLTLEQFKHLISQNCHYCDKPPVMRGTHKGGYLFVGAESLDRKDSYGSYSIDNTVAACKSCNDKKHERSYISFKQDMDFKRYVERL